MVNSPHVQMAENNHPAGADSPSKSWSQSILNPMQSDRLYNVTQLISPPPEETLRRASRQMSPVSSLPTNSSPRSTRRKRHRHTSTSLQQVQTPNPKPRKQAKQTTVPESPTKLSRQISELSLTREGTEDLSPALPRVLKAEADILLSVGAVRPTRARRSVTPIPPYEPPSDVFTPLREVMATPTTSKSSRRKSKSKTHSKLTAIRIIPIKKELPDIDLSVPMPPPSPTDDPILLSGPPSSPPAQTNRMVVSASIQTDQGEIDVLPTLDLGPSSDRVGSDSSTYFDWRGHTRPAASTSLDSVSIMDLHTSDADVTPVDLPAFDLNDLPPSSDVWSDSDDDLFHDPGITQDSVEEGEGEYTGRWKTLLVKTKQDPPSSVTRVRMEHWGRPISPFPEEAKSIQLLHDVNPDYPLVDQTVDFLSDQDYQDVLEEEEVRRISVDPEVETLTERINGAEGSFSQSSHTVIETGDSHTMYDSDSMGGGHNGSSDGESEESFIRITSADPRAAARAAAILKQYDYDCFTEISKSNRRRSRLGRASRIGTDVGKTPPRQGVIEGRITKTKAKRRSSVGTGVIGGQVFISGIPVTTLGSLLKEAEAEVSFSGTPLPSTMNVYETPMSVRPERTSDLFDDSLLGALTRQEERQWTKDDWKILDSCFTDERITFGNKLQGAEDVLVNVDHIDLDNVVQRYIDFLGGDNVIKYFGPDWDREFISRRARALRRKQRLGNVAPPTTPLPSRSVSVDMSTTPGLDVPDFTPLRERLASSKALSEVLFSPINPISVSQKPHEDESEYRKLPASLLAPRYSHLLEEATAIDTEQLSLGGPAGASDPKEYESQEDSHCESSKVRPSTTSPTLGGRFKGFLSSYIPSLSKLAPHTPKVTSAHAPQRHGLPLPPPDILEKPRGPITTPARPPLPKPKHPKELVQLHPAPLPAPKGSMIPRLVEPRRLVDLNPVPAKPQEVAPTIKPRRSSGSVKDLVEGFEELRKANEEKLKLRRSRPAWRP